MDDAFDIIDAEKAPTAKDSKDLLWNILTMLALVGAVIVGMIMLVIFINPQSGFNLFPPPTEIVVPTLFVPTSTPTSRILLPPTWTPEPTQVPSATPTLRPTVTPAPSATQSIPPTATSQAGSGSENLYSFVLQQGSPKAIERFYQPGEGCDWMGVGGQVTSLSGAPVAQMLIQLGGSLGGKPIDPPLTSITGAAIQYGRAGYEFQISDAPVASNNTLWIQLIDQASMPLSDKIYFSTSAECDKVLTLINFVQVK